MAEDAGKYHTHKGRAGLIMSACFSTEHSYIGTPIILSGGYCFPVVYIVQGVCVALKRECMYPLSYKLPLRID